jgi:death-on-curing family protein
MDGDEALVTLWDAGLDRFESPADFVHRSELRAVQHALGLTSAKEQLQVEYWLKQGSVSREALTERLAEVGIALAPSARRIPKNSLPRLRKMFEIGPRPTELAPTGTANLAPLQWETVGQIVDRRCLSYDQVVSIHEALEQDFRASNDPIFPPGIKNDHLLHSAVARPNTGFGEVLKYPTIEMAAAAVFHSIALNHAFHNGNKRAALVSLLATLDENDRVLTCTQQELFRFTLRTAQHRLVPVDSDERSDREVQEIARWIRANSRRVERGELVMKWVRLRQRLRDFDCECIPGVSGGNKINITRIVVVGPRRFTRRTRRVELRTQVGYAGDGTEADRSTLHKIRRDLRLDDANDIDSATFYRDARVGAFIIDYRRILQRLAKL